MVEEPEGIIECQAAPVADKGNKVEAVRPVWVGRLQLALGAAKSSSPTPQALEDRGGGWDDQAAGSAEMGEWRDNENGVHCSR